MPLTTKSESSHQAEPAAHCSLADGPGVDTEKPVFRSYLSGFLTGAQNAHIAPFHFAAHTAHQRLGAKSEPMELALGLLLHFALQYLYTEPYGSVSTSPPRCLLRGAFRRHATRHSGTARACGRFRNGPSRKVRHDSDGHEETCRRAGAGRIRGHGKGRTCANLQARTTRTRGRGGMDQKVPHALGSTVRRVG